VNAKEGVLWVGRKSTLIELSHASRFKVYQAKSLLEAKVFLRERPIKVIVSDVVHFFDQLKTLFPEPVRILLMDKLDVSSTQAAINRGEVFRFLPETSAVSEIEDAIDQGVRHFDLVSQHQTLLSNLKVQNRKLEKLIQKLEEQVSVRTARLQGVEGELSKTKRYLEQLNALIAWINASSSVEELSQRVEKALKGVLPVEKIVLSETTTEEVVKEVKKLGLPSIVMPLIYQKEEKKKCVGHLYFLCKNEEDIVALYEKVDLIKQISDTVALTLEKIYIFNASVERKEEWQKTFDAIFDPVALVNKHYDIIRANLSYSQISGIKIQSLVGKKCYEVFQKRKTPCEGCLLSQTLQKKKPAQFELKSTAQDTFYATSSFPLEVDNQELAVLYYRNQGEEKRLRDQLLQAEKMAEIGILAGSVAHEINNPLGGILAFTQILLSEVPKDSTFYQDLKEMEEATLRSKEIVENLLYFSRISREEDLEAIDLISVIEKALTLVNLKIRHKNITIEKHFQKTSPSTKIFGDFNQLVQVFLNIFQNSIQAILENGKAKKEGKIELWVEHEEDQKQVLVKIRDNGKGIEAEHLTNIFNPFFTTKNKTEHPGLGLSVSYQIIKNHHGKISVESEPDKGTTFIILLPYRAIVLSRS